MKSGFSRTYTLLQYVLAVPKQLHELSLAVGRVGGKKLDAPQEYRLVIGRGREHIGGSARSRGHERGVGRGGGGVGQEEGVVRVPQKAQH
jgi:hypothetical protein